MVEFFCETGSGVDAVTTDLARSRQFVVMQYKACKKRRSGAGISTGTSPDIAWWRTNVRTTLRDHSGGGLHMARCP
jgi:hypothetical protein